jgi:starch-binding outer membrane protein SusE/F
MRFSIKLILFFFGAAALLTACKKVDDLKKYDRGASTITLTLDKTSITPTPADLALAVLKLSWTDPKYATDPKSYKYVIEIDSAGKNFANKTIKTVTGILSDTLTGRELNNILINNGYATGVPVKLDIRVVSSYGNNNERYFSNVQNLTITPIVDASALTSTASTVNGSLATASNNATTFQWSPSFPGYTGVIKYEIQVDSAGKNFTSPQVIAGGDDVYTKAQTIAEINALSLAEGVVGGTTGKLDFRVKATTSQGAIAYSNVVSIVVGTYVPAYHMYLVGSMQGWDMNNLLELISDRTSGRWGKVFYTYIKLTAGDAFLFIRTPGDWNSKHGSTGGAAPSYTIGAPGTGADFTVATSGVYRVTIDLNTNKAHIQLKQVGVVGNMQGWNETAPIFGGYVKRDEFLIIAPSNGTDAFKFHDGGSWDNSAPEKSRWWGKGAGAGELTHDGSGPDIVASTSPRTRAIWNGTDPQNIKYELHPAAEMRVVGDGINQAGVNDWDPPTSPQMTYSGNGIWTISITLKANKSIKFLAGNAWGAFDYEDASGGSTATGTPRAIKWDGGPDFKTPTTAGTYTITLNEYTQTVTIN